MGNNQNQKTDSISNRTNGINHGPIWKLVDFETLEHWIDTILDEASDELTDWENTFINDIAIRVKNKWKLSQKQEEILERIYAEKTK